MKVTVFAKTAHTREGKAFIRYLGKLKKKDGSEITAVIKTSKNAKEFKPDDCPMNIEYNKSDANLSIKTYTDSDNNERTSYTLWLKAWAPSKEKYVDHSLDEFE